VHTYTSVNSVSSVVTAVARVGLRELATLTRVVASGRLNRNDAGGDGYTDRFEQLFAHKLGAKHVLAVNSGTSALISALVAAGIGPGDEVLVPAYTWIATALAPLAVGAVPTLVEIDETLTIDVDDIKQKITPHTKAIIPVHMHNLVCNMDALMAIARQHRLVVIEDACQAVGISYKGRRVGTIGDIGAFSFTPSKNISAGEGGAVITNNDHLFARARIYHDVGTFARRHKSELNEPIFAGVNFRVSELTGAVLYAQLPRLDPFLRGLRKRRRTMVQELVTSDRFGISPHHDPNDAVGLSVIFERPEDARTFASNRGVSRLIDTRKHIYTNWTPLLTQLTFDGQMNPFKWARPEIKYPVDAFSRTLDILERTCLVSLGARYPLVVVRAHARSLVRSADKQASVHRGARSILDTPSSATSPLR
jgi:dTDP-4-amino-4,6-dideoxygalactose transaminase